MTVIASLSSPAAAKAASGNPATAQREELARAAKAFEAIFVRQLIGSMRSAGMGDDLTGSSAVDQFQEMADARTADSLADQGGLGIANLLLQQLDRQTEDKPTGDKPA
ncbi:MAG TPA: rod-binding protein [Sphingobium sp.]|nr:rod-binding protein [Sphingobium sp.]